MLGAAAVESEAIAERIAKLAISAQLAIVRTMPELAFASPPRQCARVHFLIEIESARHFEASSLYLAYYALAAPGWTLMPHCIASSLTQTSMVSSDDEQRAVFGFPVELTLESDGAPASSRPPLSLFFAVLSRDMHERMTQLGYAHFAPPPQVSTRWLDAPSSWHPRPHALAPHPRR